MNRTTLERILTDPHSSPKEREAATLALAAMGETPVPIDQARPSAESELELLMVKMFGSEVTSLVAFAGVSRLADVTIGAAMDYADAQPRPLAESAMRALRGWATFRWPNPTKRLWEWVKETYPEPERRAAFERFIGKHPYLGENDDVRRDELRHLERLCSHHDHYSVCTYFLPRLEEFFSGLPEYAFALREAAQTLLAKYKSSGEMK
jgi:hypothetical protein